MLRTVVVTAAALLLASIETSAASVASHKRSESESCSLLQRRSWHALSNDERKAYIDAELCLMASPATLGLRGAVTKYDEFISLHVAQAEISHWVGQFLPFHRLLLYAHEQQLRNVCNYTGAQPYWNEALDSGNFSHSIILDPVYGFGGDGVGNSTCIADGPFASYQDAIGPGYIIAPHCITRQIASFPQGVDFSLASSQFVVDACLNTTEFVDLWNCIEPGPHGGGHGGINGEMLNPISSIGDPIFFLHHAFLDWMWFEWQEKDPLKRTLAIGGNNRMNLSSPWPLGSPFHYPGLPEDQWPRIPIPAWNGTNDEEVIGAVLTMERPADVPAPQVIGDPANETTLDHVLQMHGIVPDRVIRDVMDTRACLGYEYA